MVTQILALFLLMLFSYSSVVDSCKNLDFTPITIDETAKPGTQIFSIPVQGQESWSYKLERSEVIDGSLWDELKTYFNLKKFGEKYEMIVDKTPDLEYFYNKYTTQLLLLIKPINEFAPEFIGLPLIKRVRENTPIGTRIFSMENVTIDKDVNPSTKEISVFHLLKYRGDSPGGSTTQLDSLAYFSMPDLQKGAITVKENLDYEALSAIGSTRFILNVSAADIHGNVSYTTVEIDVVDVNDLPPEFLHPSCPLYIPRSRPCPVSFQARIPVEYKGPIRHVIPGPIQARDMDAIGDTIFMSLVKGPGESDEKAARFVIDNTTGIVSLLTPFSKPTEVALVVVAREESVQARTTQAPLRVSIVKDKDGSLTTGLVKLRNHTIPTTVAANDNDVTNKVDGGGNRVTGVRDGGVDESDDGGRRNDDSIESSTIFLVIIGVLSAIVLFLVVLSTCILCSMKKDRRIKVEPSTVPNNFPYSDPPSSYHHSLDGTSLDLTHDEFEMMSEKDAHNHNGKARHSSLSNKKHRKPEYNGRTKRTLSGFELKKFESSKDNSYHNNHFHCNLRTQNESTKKINNGQRVILDSGECDRESNLTYQENLCCTPINFAKLYPKRKIERSDSSIAKPHNRDRDVLRSRDSVRSKSSSLPHTPRSSTAGISSDQTNAIASPLGKTYSSYSSSRSETIPSSQINSTKQRHSADRPSHRQARRIKKSKSPHGREPGENVAIREDFSSDKNSVEGENRSGTASGKHQDIPSKRQNIAAKERRIRIPSGVLVMKQNVNSAASNRPGSIHENSDNDGDNDDDDDDDDDEDDVESDIMISDHDLATDDESSSCFDSFTPHSTPAPDYLNNNKLRVSFQTEPSSHTDVLSVIPMDLSSCQSSDYILEKARTRCPLEDSHTNGHSNHETGTTPDHRHVNNLHVPDVYTIPVSEQPNDETDNSLNDEINHNDKLFEKVPSRGTVHKIGHSDDIMQHHHIKPRRLPGLNIPGRKSLSQTNPNISRVVQEERPHSESVLLERRLEGSRDATTDNEPTTYRSMDNDVTPSTPTTNDTTAAAVAVSAIRKKKRKRRMVGQKHQPPVDGNSEGNHDNRAKMI